ncbi:MAG: DNA-processing protein DprA [Clostridiales bacterium]|nr:DNA-processing protein DprA [Clostridiales bacterium]
MLDRHELWFWLCNINGIGYQKIQDLLDYFGDVEAIFTAKEDALRQICSLSDKDVEYLSAVHEEGEIRRVYECLAKANVRYIIQEDEEYPTKFRQVYDSPYAFYLKGKLPKPDGPSVAIVGARNCTNYGKEVAIYFAKELAKAGVQIISGLAMGIDGYGHMGALQGKGYTLGILGSGIDVCYPKTNASLYHRMETEGGILSEYGLRRKPLAGYFPRRNRLIAGISDAILVIEARERSGSFITVDQGLELGKEIFIVPGRITDELSVGCNRLAQMGAQVVCQPKDILKYLHIESEEEDKTLDEKKKAISGKLTEKEKVVYEQLSLEPLYIGRILEKTHLEMGQAAEVLLSLEMKNVVKQIAKNYYTIRI